jgi:FkbM family methyltransferase
MRRMIRCGDTVFDVGANVGQFTFLLGHIVGRAGSIHCFEPVPVTFRALCDAARKNPVPGSLVLNDCALSDATSTVSIFVPGGDLTQAAMMRHGTASWSTAGTSVEVCPGIRSDTLDNYVSERGVGYISFIKCDVEGAELLVLRGARNILSRPVPPILLLEVYGEWTRDFGYDPRDLFEFLAKTAGYRFYHLSSRGLNRLENWNGAVPGTFPNYLNFLCVVPDVHRDQLTRVLNDCATTPREC